MKASKVLGFIAGAHSCGVAYAVDGKIVAVIEEERLTRQKTYVDFEKNFERYPTSSLNCLINRFGVQISEVDLFTSFFDAQSAINIFKTISGFEIPKEKYVQIDHHEAHAILSYHLSGFQEDTLVFCADASGGVNGHSSRNYLGKDGSMTYIDGIKTDRISLGHFYAALTELLGYKRLKDEGKIVGLSGHGNMWNELYDAWSPILSILGTQTAFDHHKVEAGGVYQALNARFYNFVGSLYWKSNAALQNIAYTGQRLFEDKVVELIRNYSKKVPSARKIALSGGIFANVKLNRRIMEMAEFDEMFVLPPMGDEGLAYGCIIGALYKAGVLSKPERVPDMFLGNLYSEQEVLNEAAGTNRLPLDINVLVDFITQKKIVGLYRGRSEHGPRALGNRSIVCEATHPETYAILNGKLQRNDYMPFAPAVLEDCADEIFDIKGSRHTMEFMTALVDTKEEWKDRIPTVVHPVDKTARIQLVTRANPSFYELLSAYRERSGVGLLVNTSFNVHNEPIVETPANAFAHLRSGIVDVLVTDYGIFTAG